MTKIIGFYRNLQRKKGKMYLKRYEELVNLGRVMLAIEKYKKSEASVEKAPG